VRREEEGACVFAVLSALAGHGLVCAKGISRVHGYVHRIRIEVKW
jgi:hypothetical protein